MGRKRKNPYSNHKDKDDNTFSFPFKRPRPSDNFHAQANDDDNHNSTPSLGFQARLDPTYGQRGAFPGLDDAEVEGGEEDLFYGPASDGLEYLRMVRSEARGVPNLLVAPQSPPAANATATATTNSSSPDRYYKNTSDDGGEGGYYADGAYVAFPVVDNLSRNGRVTGNAAAKGDTKSSGGNLELDPQEAYYISLLERFTALEVTLRSPLPADPTNSSSSTPPSIEGIHTIRKWRWVLLHRQPTMKFLSQLPQESIVNGLAALENLLERGELMEKNAEQLQRSQQLGAWAWGLLAKCRDVGEMGSEEVGVLRGLGKMAWWVMREIKAGKKEEEMRREEMGEEEGQGEGEGEGEGENRKIKGDDGVDDEVQEEEGEVHSGANEKGSDEDDGDHDHNHDMDVEIDQGRISTKHTPPPSIFNSNNSSHTTTSVHHHQTQTTTHIINPSPSGSSPNLPPPPLTSSTEPRLNGHQNHNPSSSLSRARDGDQDPNRLNNFNEPSEPHDADLVAAQQRLLNKLVSTVSPESKEPNEQSIRHSLPKSKESESQKEQHATLSPPRHPIPTPYSKNTSTTRETNQKEEAANDKTETKTETKMTMNMKNSATMDMILTIVGERYGQRDLLVGRGFWGE